MAHNLATRSATMKIDEPETPWASPPRELFEDEGARRHSLLAGPRELTLSRGGPGSGLARSRRATAAHQRLARAR